MIGLQYTGPKFEFCYGLTCLLLIWCPGGCDGTYARHRLMKDLFSSYDPRVTPVLNHSRPAQVAVRMSLHHLQQVHERNQYMQLDTWINIIWTDEFLTWNSSHYDGVDEFYVSADQIWTPDIVLYNNADIDHTGRRMYPLMEARVYSSGLIWRSTPVVMKAACKIDVTLYPFDTQRCNISFGAWNRNGWTMNVSKYSDSALLGKYVPNSEWELVGMPCHRHVEYYPPSAAPWPMVIFELVIRRKPLFYIYNFVAPCLLLIAVGMWTFILPPESGEKVSLSTTVLLAMMVFLMVIMENIPANSDVIPLVGQFIGGTICILALATIWSVLILNVHHSGELDRRPSKWLRKVALSYLARVVCLRHVAKQHSCQMTVYLQELQTEKGEKLDEGELKNELQSNGNLPSDPEYEKCVRHPEEVTKKEWRIVARVLNRTFLMLQVIFTVMMVAVLSGKPMVSGAI